MADQEYTHAQTVEMVNMLAQYGIKAEVADNAPQPDPYEDDPRFLSLDQFPEFVPEDENDDVLVRGRWLERGCAAFIVSTAGTGKSIHSLQTALCWSEGIAFAGLRPRKKLNVWLFQSEDSPTRVTIDREDIVAELSERHHEIDWRATCRRIRFVRIPGKVGAEWLQELDEMLADAKLRGTSPDVVIINPFLAFIGGPITDGQYVTPFLRGGEINSQRTTGLQDILERHRVGALIYHHTPKPPTEKELDGWLRSSFPEYQGAGSSDITNWGRSFITMMKVPKHPKMVMMTAGKNGGALGWTETDGSRRMYLHWADGESIDVGNRHAWREATDDEIEEAMSGRSADDAKGRLNADADKLAAYLCQNPSCQSDFYSQELGKKRYVGMEKAGIPEKRFRSAWAFVRANSDTYGLGINNVPLPRGVTVSFIGKPDECRFRAVEEAKYRGVPVSAISCENPTGGTGGKSGGMPPVESTGGTGGKHTPPKGGVPSLPLDSCASDGKNVLPPVNLTSDPIF